MGTVSTMRTMCTVSTLSTACTVSAARQPWPGLSSPARPCRLASPPSAPPRPCRSAAHPTPRPICTARKSSRARRPEHADRSTQTDHADRSTPTEHADRSTPTEHVEPKQARRVDGVNGSASEDCWGEHRESVRVCAHARVCVYGLPCERGAWARMFALVCGCAHAVSDIVLPGMRHLKLHLSPRASLCIEAVPVQMWQT